MDLSLSQQQQMLRRAAREFFERECPLEQVQAWDEQGITFPANVWKGMARLGWLGAAFPSGYGGAGLGIVEQGIIAHELGRAGVAVPYLSTIGLCAETILALGESEQKQWWLPQISSGDLLMALAVGEAGRSQPLEVQAVAERRGSGFIINGGKTFVHDARTARTLLVAAVVHEGGRPWIPLTVFIVDAKAPGVTVTPLPQLNGEAIDEVTLKDVMVAGDTVLGQAGGAQVTLALALRKSTALKCAEMVGAAERAYEIALDYAKRRVQFGKAIGAFQAVQHKLVDMLTYLESARLLTQRALWALDQRVPAIAEVAAAKARVSDACTKLAYQAHAVHAGIGYIKSYPLHLYTRKLMAAEVLFGTPDYHREVLADEMRL